MSTLEAVKCSLCEANGHHVEMVAYNNPVTDKDGGEHRVLYCPCCDRDDRQYSGMPHTVKTTDSDAEVDGTDITTDDDDDGESGDRSPV